MAWVWLVVAGLCEIAWAIGLKLSGGLSMARPGSSVATIVLMLASFWFLALAVRELPIGTAYAVWTGIGAIGTAILGMWLFNEPRGALRFGSIALVVIGIIGLKLASAAEARSDS